MTAKRQYRELSDITKMKISQKMKGRSKSITHREAISNGMREYWKSVPSRPTSTPTESSKVSFPTSQSESTLHFGASTTTNLSKL